MDSTPAATGPTIYNLTLVNAGQEYSQAIHDGEYSNPSIKKIQFRAQSVAHPLQYAYAPGGPYFDLLPGEVYWQDGLHVFRPFTLYFKSTSAGAIVDIEVWK